MNVNEGHHNAQRFDRKLFVNSPTRCLTRPFLVSEQIPADDSAARSYEKYGKE